jgi:DNA-binding CsgD family transcriptional regulator/tetratricopeptide (TPR) repeat protein
MSTVIAMAFLNLGPDIHLGGNPVQRIEEIRRLTTRYRSMSRETERDLAEAQMLYGVHVFARAKMIPDLAVSRGEDAHRAATAMGDRALEFSSAGGVALALLDLGEAEQAERWLDRAAAAAAASPTPARARRLELWRGMVRAAAGDVDGMRAHFERSLEAAAGRGRPPARCETLARLALEAARLGTERGDEELLELAERSAREAKQIAPLLPAHPPWNAQAEAALAQVALARGRPQEAIAAARAALTDLQAAMREDFYPEILIPMARALLAAGDDSEREQGAAYIRIMLAMVAHRTQDESVRVQWFRGPIGRELVKLVGPVSAAATPSGNGAGLRLEERQSSLLRLLTEGLTNAEIAARLGTTAEAVGFELTEMFAAIGASSRGEATTFALSHGVL